MNLKSRIRLERAKKNKRSFNKRAEDRQKKKNKSDISAAYVRLNTSQEIISIYHLIEILGDKPGLLNQALKKFDNANIKYVQEKIKNQPEWSPIHG